MTEVSRCEPCATTDPLLPEYFALHGRWRRQKLAVRFGDEALTWAEFHERLDCFARGLASSGVPQGSVIAILADNRLETVELMIGALYAGMVACPLSLGISDEALQLQIMDSGARVVFATPAEAQRIDRLRKQAELPAHHYFGVGFASPGWSSYESWRDNASSISPVESVQPEMACTLIYSSGTTGAPKGILHSQLARLNFAMDCGMALRFHEESVAVCSIGLYSNAMWLSMLCSLARGGCVSVLPHFDPGTFLDSVLQHGITHAFLVPVQIQALLETKADFVGCGLEVLVTAGAPLSPQNKVAARSRFACTLLELYGLTEGFATTLQAQEGVQHPRSAGRPLPGADMQVILEDGRSAGSGQGEIVARSRMMMMGYHRRADLTERAFWSDSEGATWLRTGDIGQIDSTGLLKIVGRIKEMILSGGANVYPADIESIALEHEQVTQVAVIGVPDPKWGESPFAYVVPASGAPPVAPGSLMAWINARLGRHQKLKGLAYREALPANQMGKVLRNVLLQEYLMAVAATHIDVDDEKTHDQ